MFGIQFCSILVLEVVKNTENDTFSLISSSLMSIFSPNVGHQENKKNNIQMLNYYYSAKHFPRKSFKKGQNFA